MLTLAPGLRPRSASLRESTVRTLIAAAAAIIAVGAASPTLAAPPLVTSAADPALVRVLSGTGTADLSTVRKKKKEAASIKEVKGAKQGKKGLKIKVKVVKDDRRCEMEIEFNDGSAPEIEDVEAGTDKYCVFSINVPNDEDVVGEATMTVTVKSATGKKLVEVEGSFTVDEK
jgi:hypothetical protein